jgi:hypothetical protein
MRLALSKSGVRKFRCIYCEGHDPMRSATVAKLLNGELGGTSE